MQSLSLRDVRFISLLGVTGASSIAKQNLLPGAEYKLPKLQQKAMSDTSLWGGVPTRTCWQMYDHSNYIFSKRQQNYSAILSCPSPVTESQSQNGNMDKEPGREQQPRRHSGAATLESTHRRNQSPQSTCMAPPEQTPVFEGLESISQLIPCEVSDSSFIHGHRTKGWL